LEKCASVVDDPYDLELRLKEVLAGFGQQRVVIGNYQSGPVTRFHGEVPLPFPLLY